MRITLYPHNTPLERLQKARQILCTPCNSRPEYSGIGEQLKPDFYRFGGFFSGPVSIGTISVQRRRFAPSAGVHCCAVILSVPSSRLQVSRETMLSRVLH